MYTYSWFTLFEVWQKSTQHCKAIILQLKIKEKEKQLVIQCKGHFTQFNKHRLELNMSVLQFKKQQVETSLAVQWLKLRASNAGNARWIPGSAKKIPYACHVVKKKRQ